MLKKYIEIKVDGKVVQLCEVKECEPLEFIKKQQEAQANFEKLQQDRAAKEREIENLKHEIKVLKGEE